MTSASTKKNALVTGGNAGIGFETCRGLLEAGFHVILCARTIEKAEKAIDELLADAPAGSTAEPLVLDLAVLNSVRKAAQAFLDTGRALSVCVLNAGIMALPWKKTEDGFEQQWQVNVLGHFLLGRLLLPAIQDSGDGRIVHLSSRAHMRYSTPIDYERLRLEHISEENYDRWVAYGRSKLANILFSNELARRLDSLNVPVTSNALHPGLVATNLLANANAFKNQGITPAEGALTSIYLATSPEVAGQSGGYYQRSKPVLLGGDRTEISTSLEEGQRFWTAACNELGLSEEL